MIHNENCPYIQQIGTGAGVACTCPQIEEIELNSFNHQFVTDGRNAGFTDSQLNFLSEYFFNQE